MSQQFAPPTVGNVDPYSADIAQLEASQTTVTDRSPPRRRSMSRSRSRSRSPVHRSAPVKSSDYPPRRPHHAPANVTPSAVLGVFGLSIRTQERDLEDEFSRFGKVEKVTIVYDQRSDRSRGFGFIRMSNEEDAARCIQELNGLDLQGRRIRVDYSMTDRPHQSTPGRYMGHRTSTDDDRDRDRGYRSSRYDRDRYDRDRYDRDRHGRDRYERPDRDRDDYGRDRGRDRDRERDRRSPRRRSGDRYSRRSRSRSIGRDRDRENGH